MSLNFVDAIQNFLIGLLLPAVQKILPGISDQLLPAVQRVISLVLHAFFGDASV